MIAIYSNQIQYNHSNPCGHIIALQHVSLFNTNDLVYKLDNLHRLTVIQAFVVSLMDTCGSQLGASVDGLKTPSKTGRVQFAWWSHQAHWLRWLRVDVSWRLMEWWCVMQGEGIDIAPLASTVASASWRSFLKHPKTAQRWKSRDIALILFGKGSTRFELVPLLSSWLSRKVPGVSRHQGFPVAVEMVRHVTGLKKRSCKGHLSKIRYRRLERLDPTEGPQSSSCILCLFIYFVSFVYCWM